MIPQKLGRYEVIAELGKGAMGLVFLARDPLIGRQLALKTFRLGYSAKDAELEQFRVRFLREAQSAGILSHPNIVTIHDVVVEDGGDFFIAMEYVKGTDLKHVMQRQDRLDLRFVVDIIAQIADGLDYAHSKGVVHRDIKPANIILTAERQAKITDFGIARVDASNLTIEGQLLGTPNYMAPEQIQGKEVDHRADLFSLGVMLYEMVTGKKPFAGENLTVVTHRIVYEAFTPAEELVMGLPPRLSQVLEKSLQKDVAKRYARGADMARDLRAVFSADTSRGEATTASFLTEEAPPAPSAGPGTMIGTAQTVFPTGFGSGTMSTGPTIQMSPSAGNPLLTPALGTMVSSPPPPLFPPVPPIAAKKSKAMLFVWLGLVALVALAGGYWILDGKKPVTVPVTVQIEKQTNAEAAALIAQAKTLLDKGEAVQAIELYDRALVLQPGDQEIRRLREQAQRVVLGSGGVLDQKQISDQLARADAALRAGDFDTAARLAGEVLAIDALNERGLALRNDAEAGKRRRDELRRAAEDRFRPQVIATTPPGPTSPVQPTTRPESGDASLLIDFYSDVSEGVLSVWVGSKKIYDENFRFVGEKTGVFRKPKNVSGSLNATSKIPAGATKLRVYVFHKASGTPVTVSEELPAEIVAGSVRTLKIRVSEDGDLDVKLE